jgi:hypothetical protein
MQQFKYEWNIEKVMWTRLWRAVLSRQKKYSDILSISALGMEQSQNIFLLQLTILHTKRWVYCSEWMGFYLLHESMLDSVIRARDKHLQVNILIDSVC